MYELISLMQDTKNKMHLIHRLTRLETCNGLMRQLKRDERYSLRRLLQRLAEVARFLVSPA